MLNPISENNVINVFDTARPGSPVADSPYEDLKKIDNMAVDGGGDNSIGDLLIQQNGLLVTKTNTCNGNGAQADNIFSITGTVDILAVWGVCTEATNSTVLSGNSLAVYDGTVTLELTDSGAPTDCSAMNFGDCVFKNGASATVAIAYHNIGQVMLTDLTQTKARVNKKVGANTYIQHLFTGDANTDVDIKWYVRYVPVSDDGAVSAV